MSSSVTVTVTLVSFLCLCVSVSAISNCPENSINCKVCPNNARSNDIAGIPRLNKNGAFTPASIGAYTMVDCTDTGSSCVGFQDSAYGTKSDNTAKTQTLFDRLTSSPRNDKDPVNYIWSLLVHVIIALLLVLFTILCGCGLLVGRYCCCCIKGGTCGKRWPTLRTKFIGFTQNTQTGEYEYPNKEKWVVRVYMWIFVFCIFLFIGLGYFEGTQKIAPSMKSVASSPTPIYNTLQSTATPIADLIVRVVSETLPTTIHNINNTINGIVDLGLLANNVNCIIGIVPRLPNVVYLSGNISAIGASIDNIQNTFNIEVPTYKASLQRVVDNVTNDVDSLSARLNDISTNLTATNIKLDQSTAAANDIDTFVATEINNPTDGIPATASDVNAMKNMPTATETESANAGLQSIATMTTTTSTDQTNANIVITQLKHIDNGFQGLPNLTVTANNMDKFNTRLQSSYRVRVINAVYNNLTATQQQINGIYHAIDGVSAALNHLTNVTILYANMTFDGARASIGRINASILSTPSLSLISSELGLVQQAKNQVIPCANSLTTQIIAINAQLVKLPNYVLNVSTHTNELQSGLDTAIAKVNETQSKLADLDRSRTNDIHLSDFLNQIATLQNTLSNQTNTLINGPYIQDLRRVSNDTGLNYTVSDQVITFNNTMNNASIPQSTITNTKQAELFREGMYNSTINITRIIQDLDIWANRGVCTGPGAIQSNTPCTQPGTLDSACSTPGQICSTMIKRCRVQQYKQCTQNSDCTATDDYCLVVNPQLLVLAGALHQYSVARPSDTEITNSATALNQTSAASKLGTTQLKNGITAAKNSIAQVNPNSFQTTINSTKTHLLTDINLDSQQSQINSLNNTISGLKGTLGNSQDQINQLNNTYATVRSQLADMNTATNVITFVQQTLMVKINDILDNLDVDTMEMYRTQDGQQNNIGAMIGYIASQFDDFTTYWNKGQNIYALNNGTSYYNQTQSLRDWTSRLTNTQDAQYGAIYALGRLFQKSDTIEASLTLDGDMVLENAQQISYSSYPSDGRYGGATKCLTKKCIDATIDFYTGSSIGTLLTKAKISSSVNMNLTPIQFLSLPLLFCFVCGLLGLVSSFMFHSYKWASWCSSITLCWIWVLMPIMFLLSAITFPIVLFTGDTCMGIEDVANQYLLGRQNFACTSDAQGIGTATQCIINIDGQILQSTINIPALYSSIVGNGCSGGNDAVADILESMRPQLETYPTNQAISFINSTNQIQPKLRDALITSTRDTVLRDVIGTTLDQFKSTVGCSALSSSYKSAKSGFCCDAATAIYWSIGTWYLIGWSMLFCGCGAALLGRKRFGRGLWGDDYDLLTQPDMVKYDGDPLSIQPHEASGNLMVVASVVTTTHHMESPSVEMLSPPPYAALNSPSPNAAVAPSPSLKNERLEGRRASLSSVDSRAGEIPPTTDGPGIELSPSAPPGEDHFRSEFKPSPISHSHNPSTSPANRLSEPLVHNEQKQEEHPTVVMISE